MSRKDSNQLLNEVCENDAQAVSVIDYQKVQLHEGNQFFIDRFGMLNNTEKLVWALNTDGKDIHINISLVSAQRTTVHIYEDESFTGGTPTVSFNSNRNSLNLSSVTTYVNPSTYTTVGTNIISMTFGGGFNPANSVGGDVQRNVLLKKGITYIVVIESFANDNYIDYRINWLEK